MDMTQVEVGTYKLTKDEIEGYLATDDGDGLMLQITLKNNTIILLTDEEARHSFCRLTDLFR
jgi:hypothetical protein